MAAEPLGDCPIIRLTGVTLGAQSYGDFVLCRKNRSEVWAAPAPLIRWSSGVLWCTATLILTPSTPSFWTQPGTEKGTKLIVSGDKTGDSRFDLSGAKNLGDTKAKWEVHDVWDGTVPWTGDVEMFYLQKVTSSIQLVTICRMLGLISCWTI